MKEFESLAMDLMFTCKFEPEKYNLTYREGRTMKHVADALRLCRKNGRGKTEYELEFLEIYLKRIFKEMR